MKKLLSWFSGCVSIFAWDVTSSRASAGCPEIPNPDVSANYSLTCDFGDGLSESLQCIVICEVEKNLMLGSNNNWSLV